MELHYFLTTNGSQGHISYLKEALLNYRDVVYLEGYPKPLAAKLVRECYLEAKKRETQIEMIHNPLDNTPEGILLPEYKTALVNIPIYDAEYSLANLMINEQVTLYNKHLDKAIKHFKNALSIHDDWEAIYKSATDYQTLDNFTQKTIDRLLHNQKQDKKGTEFHRFFGSATINGSVDYVEVLSDGLKRYLIKGRPGTGKSTFMKRLASRACEQGYNAECYHCSFDPSSLDMVVIRELGFCVFDATPPHEYAPSEQNDEVIDLYAAAESQDTDEVNKKELDTLSRSYKNSINSAIKHLMLAHDAILENDAKTMKQVDRDRTMVLLQKMIERLFKQ